MWSFGRKKRFNRLKTECPHVYYEHKISTISQLQVSFAQSTRKPFDDGLMTPPPNAYHQDKGSKIQGGVMGLGRKVSKNLLRNVLRILMSVQIEAK